MYMEWLPNAAAPPESRVFWQPLKNGTKKRTKKGTKKRGGRHAHVTINAVSNDGLESLNIWALTLLKARIVHVSCKIFRFEMRLTIELLHVRKIRRAIPMEKELIQTDRNYRLLIEFAHKHWSLAASSRPEVRGKC